MLLQIQILDVIEDFCNLNLITKFGFNFLQVKRLGYTITHIYKKRVIVVLDVYPSIHPSGHGQQYYALYCALPFNASAAN